MAELIRIILQSRRQLYQLLLGRKSLRNGTTLSAEQILVIQRIQ